MTLFILYNSVPFYILLIVLFYGKSGEIIPAKTFFFLGSRLAAFYSSFTCVSGRNSEQNYVATYLRWLPSWTFFITKKL